jgi:hypothetical protein
MMGMKLQGGFGPMIPKVDAYGNPLPRDPMWNRLGVWRREKIVEKDDEVLEPVPEATVKPKLGIVEAEPRTKKIGRPKSDKPKPWDGTGLSKSEYYRKKSKGEV